LNNSTSSNEKCAPEAPWKRRRSGELEIRRKYEPKYQNQAFKN
jgi:hypothetical protein